MNYPQLEKVIQVVKKLRDPNGGCPWDLEQTHQSLLRFLIEESYEFVHAAETADPKMMEDELGDVLLQVLLHCTIGEEEKNFSLESVSQKLAEKMIRRHPHVFEKNHDKISSSQVKENWEKIKKEEQAGKQKYHIKKSDAMMPSLMSAYKIGKKTEKLHFDWENYSQVVYKVEEEWQELKEELTPHRAIDQERVSEELGDFLFSVAQLARHLKLEPETILRQANLKFIRRFNAIEDMINQEDKKIEDLSQKEMDSYWDAVKKREKKK